MNIVLDFLGELFTKRLEFGTIAGYRSAISAYHKPIDGVRVGQHPLVSCLMKGVSNERPPLPRYRYIWNVETVLQKLRELPNNTELDRKTLTHKTAALLGLCAPNRGNELHALDEKFMSKMEGLETYYKCAFHGRVKHSRVGKQNPTVSFYQFSSDPKLCPVACIDEYIRRTKLDRSENKTTQLWLATKKPFNPVTKSTVTKWVLKILKLSGIDTNKFKGHSVRSASTSNVANKGLELADILSMGNWSGESVWQKYYHKEVEITPAQRYQKSLLGGPK